MSTVDEAAGRPVPCGVSSSRFEDEDEDDDEDEGLAPAPITVRLRKGASREVGRRRHAAPQVNGEEKGSGFGVQVVVSIIVFIFVEWIVVSIVVAIFVDSD
jgi:hypothetical protein